MMRLSILAVVFVCQAVIAIQVAASNPAVERASIVGAGINLSSINDWSTELPFNDQFKLSRRWISQREGAGWGEGPELNLDRHGQVMSLEPGCFAETVLFIADPPFVYPPGQFTMLYEGDGVLVVTQSRIASQRPGRIVFEPNPGQSVFLQLRRTNPENPVRNIRVIHPGVDPENPPTFRQQFLDRWAGMRVIRFMDWMRTNDSPIRSWDQRPQLTDSSWAHKGVPLEIMVELANTLQIDPWFCVPHLADDDYVRQMARLLRDTVDPKLHIYIEYSNELWNGQFEQAHFVNNEGLRLGLGEQPWTAGWHYTARRSVEIFNIFEQEFEGRDRLIRVISSQAGNAYIARQLLQLADAHRHTDALAIAPYVSMNLPPKRTDGRLDAQTVAGWTVEQVMDHVMQNALPEAISQIREHKQIADQYGLALIAYEAGQHLTGIHGGENNEALIELFKRCNRSDAMGEVYRQYLTAWEQAGGGVIAMFGSTSRWTKWGMWGLLESWQQEPHEVPKAAATFEWHRRVSR